MSSRKAPSKPLPKFEIGMLYATSLVLFILLIVLHQVKITNCSTPSVKEHTAKSSQPFTNLLAEKLLSRRYYPSTILCSAYELCEN